MQKVNYDFLNAASDLNKRISNKITLINIHANDGQLCKYKITHSGFVPSVSTKIIKQSTKVLLL
jgi:hypothetical protein